MGLDMYAYRVKKEHVVNDFEFNSDQDPAYDIAYWRKFNALHGWMERLYREKGGTAESFNCVKVRLTKEDLERLAQDVMANKLPETTGFFFGNPSDEHYRESDLRFIKEARAELFLGLKVFYNSSW